MRMRKKKNLDTRFLACEKVMITNPQNQKGKWHDIFSNSNPIHLEIGCGKGKFITELAKRNPTINFIAIEREQGALIMATEKAKTLNLPNLKFLSFDAQQLESVFNFGEIDRIYLNFSDPWPPNRQRRRRLTHADYLDVYNNILCETGGIYFKTDNQRLFEWSLQSVCEYGLLLKNISLDLHNSQMAKDNILTEYEEKFSSQGFRIYYFEAYRRLPIYIEKRRPKQKKDI